MSGRGTIEQLTLRLGRLRISISEQRGDSGSPTPSADSFVLVEGDDTSGSQAVATSGPLAGGAAAPRAATARSTDEAFIAARTPEELAALNLGAGRALVRRLSASGAWTPEARIGRAIRAGISAGRVLRGLRDYQDSSLPLGTRNRVYIVLACPSRPAGFYCENFAVFREHCPQDRQGRLNRSVVCHGFPSRAEAEAFEIIQLLTGAPPGRPLPLVYLIDDDTSPTVRVTAFLLRRRAGGFMVALPNLEQVSELLANLSLSTPDAQLYSTEAAIACETPRRRPVGDVTLLLADIPWAWLGLFRRGTAMRSSPLQLLSIMSGSTVVRPVLESALGMKELRFWSGSCNNSLAVWTALGLSIFFCCFGCILGALCTSLLLSAAARRACSWALRFFAAWLDLAPGPPARARVHLSQSGRGTIEQLTLRLGRLRISISEQRGDSGSPTPSADSFVLVEGDDTSGSQAVATSGPLAGGAAAPRAATARSTDEAFIAARTPEELAALNLGAGRALVRRLSASGAWTPEARIGRAIRAGISAGRVLRGLRDYQDSSLPLGTRNRVYIVLACPSRPAGFYCENFAVFREHCPQDRQGRLNRSVVCHGFPSRAEAEAFEIIQLLTGAPPGRPLPLVYLIDDDTSPTVRVTAFLLRRRAGGFMVALPNLEQVSELLANLSLSTPDAQLYSTEAAIACETPRRRPVGDVTLLLADIPWAWLGLFRRGTAMRSSPLQLLSIMSGSTVVRPVLESALEAAEVWIASAMEEPDLQESMGEYATAAEHGEPEANEAEDEGEGPDAELVRLRAQVAALELAAQTQPPPAVGARAARATGAQTRRGLVPRLTPGDLARLQEAAGAPPPRVAQHERAPRTVAVEDADNLLAELDADVVQGEALRGGSNEALIHKLLLLQTKMLSQLSAGRPQGVGPNPEAGGDGADHEMEAWFARLALFVDQAATEGGRTQLAWLLAGLPELDWIGSRMATQAGGGQQKDEGNACETGRAELGPSIAASGVPLNSESFSFDPAGADLAGPRAEPMGADNTNAIRGLFRCPPGLDGRPMHNIGCLNWLALGCPSRPPDRACVGTALTESQHGVLGTLERHCLHFLRAGRFASSTLGRSSEKFDLLFGLALELPQCDLAPASDVDRMLNQFDPPPAQNDPLQATTRGEVVADRIKWTLPPSFDPMPFFSDVHCSRAELLRLAAKWDDFQVRLEDVCDLMNMWLIAARCRELRSATSPQEFFLEPTLTAFRALFQPRGIGPALAVLQAVFEDARRVPRNSVLPLQRGSINELFCLCALGPLLQTDLRVNYPGMLFCMDASPTGAGLCAASLPPAVLKELWRHGEQKGFYAKLLEPASALLAELELSDDPGIDFARNVGDGVSGAFGFGVEPLPLRSALPGPATFLHLFANDPTWDTACLNLGLHRVPDSCSLAGLRFEDLASDDVFHRLRGLLMGGVVFDLHVSAPALSFVPRGRCRLRSPTSAAASHCRWGLLRHHDRLARRLCFLLCLAASSGVYFSVSQPAASLLFRLHCFRGLVALGGVLTRLFCCDFGAPYKRALLFLHNKPWLLRLASSGDTCGCPPGAKHFPVCGTFSAPAVDAFCRACSPSASAVFGASPAVGQSVSSFCAAYPAPLACRIASGSALAASGYVPPMPIVASWDTLSALGLFHDDPEWIGELADCLDFRELVRYKFRKGGHINILEARLQFPTFWALGFTLAAFTCTQLSTELTVLLVTGLRQPLLKRSLPGSPRLSMVLGRWVRFLLLLAGDIERNPGPPSRLPRGSLDLQSGFATSTRHKMTKALDAFILWLSVEFGLGFDAAMSSSQSAACALRAFTPVAFHYRSHLSPAWQIDRKWQLAEPGECRPVISQPILQACIALAICWGWYDWAALTCVGFLCMLHPAEMIPLIRQDLVFPEDALSPDPVAYVHLRSPKTQRFASRQHARLEDPLVLRLLEALYFDLPLGARLFRGFAWNSIMSRLGVPCHLSEKGATPGVLRGSGATFLYLETEDLPLVAWRGRWSTTKTVEFYLQEVAAQLLLHRLPVWSRERIRVLSSFSRHLLLEVIANCGGAK
ncbi:Scn10a [Symbiodinium sp. CCMP2592]|nr:Scn10a [Symbiodinium sp. CCMP2592]